MAGYRGREGARTVAASLTGPVKTAEGAALPATTGLVLSRYGADRILFERFSIGLHSLQTYSGDIAAQHEEEARLAEYCLHHKVPAIRRWAALEIRSSLEAAKHERQRYEEEFMQ